MNSNPCNRWSFNSTDTSPSYKDASDAYNHPFIHSSTNSHVQQGNGMKIEIKTLNQNEDEIQKIDSRFKGTEAIASMQVIQRIQLNKSSR